MPLPFSTLLTQLKNDFPDYTFLESGLFKWSPQLREIHYQPDEPHVSWLLLHELAHAELGHTEFIFDIELLRQETLAWEYARSILTQKYAQVLEEAFIQDNLDSYRDWLYKRSLCPNCNQTGVQHNKNTYSCLNCRYSWRVNDARQGQLRRYNISA